MRENKLKFNHASDEDVWRECLPGTRSRTSQAKSLPPYIYATVVKMKGPLKRRVSHKNYCRELWDDRIDTTRMIDCTWICLIFVIVASNVPAKLFIGGVQNVAGMTNFRLRHHFRRVLSAKA